MRIDHLVVVADRLEDGAAHVQDVLGVAPGPGGRHAAMGTRNLLLSLGPDTYLEVIAVDPEAAAPDRPRWFGLDDRRGPPRLGAWAMRCDDLPAVLGEAPMGMGDILEMTRGDLRWSISVPRSGRQPCDGIAPALVEWHGTATPQDRLEPSGCRLERLVLRHPDAGRIRSEWPALGLAPRVVLETGRDVALEAEIVTPRGLRTLSSLIAGG